jgi:hypothetical protein
MMRTHLTNIFFFVVVSSVAFAQQAAVVPHRYPLKHPLSAANALKRYKEVLKKIEDIQKPITTNQPSSPSQSKTFDCPRLDGSIRQCIDDRPLRYYVGEYLPYVSNSPALVPTSETSSLLEGGAAVTGFVPVEKVVEGQAELKRLQDREKNKKLSDCNDQTGECKTIVEAIPAKEDEQTLAVCDVAHVGEETGAVKNCVAVAIIAKDASYIRAVIAYKPQQATTLPTDEWAGSMEFHIEKGSPDAQMPSLQSVLNVFQSALGSTFGLNLKTELLPKANPVSAIGVAGLRKSDLLKALFERISIRVDVTRSEEGESSMKVYYNLRVNQPGRDQPEDLRSPTEVELRAYEGGFESKIMYRLIQLLRPCLLPSRIGDMHTFVCGRSISERPKQGQTSSQ